MKLYLFKYSIKPEVFSERVDGNKIIRAKNIKEAVNELNKSIKGYRLIIESVYSEEVDGDAEAS